MRVILMAVAFLGFAQMAPAQQMTNEQVKQLALEAILENPQIIMQAVAILEQRERERAASGANTVRLQLEQDPNSPNLGNPDGDVTVIEFFDYNCPYCRKAGQTVQELLASDANVRVIYREWPILGEDSVFASRAALAARAQGKYEEFHWALMNGEGRASEASILKLARHLDLDVEKLQADMTSPAVEAHIAQSSALARTLGFTGTPAFIVGDRTAPGMLSTDEITAMVAEARAAK
ncbi:DsbA family protein [uncultured Planktomarina sp.]|uniref:DsbA family protein n=1 Tax=uncultured Planktomarina sp. TaxID=1538529 RepID=UPI0032616811